MTTCEWPVARADYAGDTIPVISAAKTPAEEMAVELLWHWTHEQFGVFEILARPCSARCVSYSTFFGRGGYPYGVGYSGLMAIGGGLALLTGCACSGACTCIRRTILHLPGPVVSITEVLVDGEVLDATAYRLESNKLIRSDGEEWPQCQNFALDTTEDNTWQITYKRGNVVPMGGQVAAGLLAVQLEKALREAEDCQLPVRIQSLTRQGVTVAVMDTFEDLDKGRTGIWAIDAWIVSVNASSARRGRVFSVDVPRGRRS